MTRRIAVPLLIAVVTVGVVVAALLASDSGHSGRSQPSASDRVAPGAVGSRQRFTYLVSQHSNTCGMPAATVLRMRSSERLQGSCCGPMNGSEYTAQASGLRQFRTVPEIPRDPYDVPVALAKRLLRWERSIKLSHAQFATYRQAMKMSREHAPCCCPCWRWHAFSGLANELIARRRYSAARLARVIDLVEGCGDTSHGGYMMRRPRA